MVGDGVGGIVRVGMYEIVQDGLGGVVWDDMVYLMFSLLFRFLVREREGKGEGKVLRKIGTMALGLFPAL